jgi:hypothetical protein
MPPEAPVISAVAAPVCLSLAMASLPMSPR